MPRNVAERHAGALEICIVPLADDFAAFKLRLCVRRLDELPAATGRLVGSLLGSAAPPALQWQATAPTTHPVAMPHA